MDPKEKHNPEPIDPERVLLKASEVARRLALARSTVYAMMASGELEVIRKGRAVRVPVTAIGKWIDSHGEQGA